MSRELFLQFLKAETEEEVTKVIKTNGLDNINDWIPYGEQPSNWSIIGNQSSSAERALVEKVTNSVDALLMRKCLELGIDPHSEEAPKSPREALIRFFGIEDGKSSNLTKKQEEEICEELYLIATSQDMKPIKQLGRNAHVNLMIYDGGEGQSPDKLPNTILSLLRGNKQGIPFTQGNYNQGGSGALMYCGEKGYCLVVSRRYPYIDPKFKDQKDQCIDQWGWTLIRMELRQDTKDPMFSFYAPNGKVPRFESRTLPLKPRIIKGKDAQNYLEYESSCSAGLPYQVEVEYGTAIKMFNYGLKQKGPMVSHFKYELSRCILDTYLPLYVVDCRKNKFNNYTQFRGFNKLLEDDLNEKNTEKRLINEHFPVVATFRIDNQEVKLTTYGLNHRKSGEKNANSFVGDSSPIRFTLGQQFQGDLNKTIFSSSGLGVLKDSLLMIVEFPNLDPIFKKDLFMTDRERLLDKRPKKEIIAKIKTFLSQDETLQDFASEKMKKIMTDQTADDPNVKSALEKWLENSPDIQQALGFGSWFPKDSNAILNSGSDSKGKKGNVGGVSVNLNPDPIETNEIPTYFEPILRKNANGDFYTTVTKGKRFSIRFKTDANEDLFDRPIHQGRVSVTHKGEITDQYTCNVRNGKASINFTEKITSRLGESPLTFSITCDQVPIEFSYKIEIIVKEDTDVKENGDKKAKQFTGLPPYKEIFKEEWPDEVNETTGATIQTFNNTAQYLINMDNVYLQNKLLSTPIEGEKEFYKKLYIYAMLFSALSAKNVEDERRKTNPEGFEKTIEEEVARATESVARTFFVMEQLSSNLRKSIALTV